MKSNIKDFYKYVSSKRKTRENMGPLLSRPGDLLTKDQGTEKTKVLRRPRYCVPSLPQPLPV